MTKPLPDKPALKPPAKPPAKPPVQAKTPDRAGISEAERDVLKALWEHGPGTVRQLDAVLRRHGRRWAYNTVLTLLQRLQSKGYVVSDKGGVAHVFRAAVSREELLQSRLKDLADQLCEGTASPLVLALVEGHSFTPEEIDQFRRLLDQLAPRSPRK
jgi:BlaI family transcriptional regulator, penicillinase repressor